MKEAKQRSTFGKRIRMVLSLTVLFFFLIMLVQLCRVQFGNQQENIEWKLQIGQGEAIVLSKQESTGSAVPSVNLRLLADLMQLRLQGEAENPTVLAPSVGGGAESRIAFVNGSNVVTVNGERVLLARAVIAKQGDIYVEISFLQTYFTGLEITYDINSGLICITPSEQDAPACKVPLES